MDKTTLFLLLLIAAAGGGYYGYRTSPSFKNHVDQARAKVSSLFCAKACSSCSGHGAPETEKPALPGMPANPDFNDVHPTPNPAPELNAPKPAAPAVPVKPVVPAPAPLAPKPVVPATAPANVAPKPAPAPLAPKPVVPAPGAPAAKSGPAPLPA